jgi:hypothetical protein
MTDNTQKDWNASAPFHRIHAPYYDTSMTHQPAGDGYGAGCRNPAKWIPLLGGLIAPPLGALVVQKRAELVRMIPNWVAIDTSDLVEVEGDLVRSFQTWTDTPMFQWHRWYDWNFHVKPMDGYKYVRGVGNEIAPPAGKTPIVPDGAMELEWDTGAFGWSKNPMFDADWAWPMTGQHLWAAGRWIYDCGHANNGKMRTELHPVRAVATARWEAAKFEAYNTKVLWPPTAPQSLAWDTYYLPAIQFMFFASKFGGYADSAELPDWKRDFEFIVDLPRDHGPPANPAPIGPQHDFPLNTIVLKSPKLLCSFNYRPFTYMRTANAAFSHVPPEVTYDAARPDQVNVKIPLSKLPAGSEAYGVIISLGWLDDNNDLARKVMHCTVTMGDIVVSDAKTGSLTFKWGANGRWKRQHFDNVQTGNTLKLDAANQTIDFWLMKDIPTAAGADIFINMHGKAVNSVGQWMLKSDSDRTLHTTAFDQGPVVTWNDVVHGSDSLISSMIDSIAYKLSSTLNQQNQSLGIEDLHLYAGSVAPGAAGNDLKIEPPSVVDDPQLAELYQGSGKDYAVMVNVRVDPQSVP